MAGAVVRCDLHVHSRFSTDSGNYALRRARLPESYTEPERVYRVATARGMEFVTISDHNTLEGALRIAHLPKTFLSVEVTTSFPEDGAPLHVLVWDLSEEDHRDLQPYRPSVYELVALLRERQLPHALAHPLYRMGPPLTADHVERMMLLFSVWEGRNGARPEESNTLAVRLAETASPGYLAKLAAKHGTEPPAHAAIALTGGSDDHGSIDVATTWTSAAGDSPRAFLESLMAGACTAEGAHGSAVKLAHAMAAIGAHAYRQSQHSISPILEIQLRALFDEDAPDAHRRHAEIRAASRELVSMLGSRAREGGLRTDSLASVGPRLAALTFAGALELPYLASAHHHKGARTDIRLIEKSFFGAREEPHEPRSLVFTDTFVEANGVSGTMRRLAAEGTAGRLPIRVATAGSPALVDTEGLIALPTDWSMPLPAYEHLSLRFPLLTDVLERVEAEAPDVIHVATPGPIGVTGLVVAKILGLPVVGSYHTELGPFALHITRDAVVADLTAHWVDWFYRQCDLVLAPTLGVMASLTARGAGKRVLVWGRGVDTSLFGPDRFDPELRRRLLGDGDLLLLSVGRISEEKRLEILLDAFETLRRTLPGARLVIVGDGPTRKQLEGSAGEHVRFLGEVRDGDLAAVFASADIFCFPSTTDTFGQVLLEAGASGLPIVCVAAGGGAELVRDGATGFVVPPDDQIAFAQALMRLGVSERLRRKFGAAARRHALSRTWERSWDELRSAYAVALHLGTVPERSRIAA